MSQKTPDLPSLNVKRGDVYWVRIPKHQAEGSEQRDTDESNPHAYVIVSRNSANDRLHSAIGVPLSTRLNKVNKTYRPLINATDILPSPGSSTQDCVALCDHVREISLTRLRGKLGVATISALSRIDNALAFVLASD
jgi:mRNA-degrading endonuclease toxin of MazEF toxin-antitoxin module